MTMFCPDEEKLSAWVERSLAAVDEETVSVHLAACDDCRRAATLAFLSAGESPGTLESEGERRIFLAVQGALAEPSACVPEDMLAAWLQDGLGPEERGRVTQHLSSCDDCRHAAALTRLSTAEPVSALGADQEARALDLVLRTASRDAFFSFWRVAAASIVVAVAASYVSVHWTAAGATRSAPVAVTTEGDRTAVGNVSPSTPTKAATPSDKPADAPGVEPEKSKPSPVDAPPPPLPAPASRFQPVPVYEWEGIPAPALGRLSFGEALRPQATASVNVEGRALVVLDEGTEARLGYAADASALVVEVGPGRVFIDTAGASQNWEIRRGDRSVTLRAFRGRAAAETDPAGLRVLILRGSAEVGADRVESNRVVEVLANSEVRVEDGSDACRPRAQRYDVIRPRTLLVFRGIPGSTSTEGPWRFVSPSRWAETLEDGARLVPGITDPVRWVAVALDEPLPYASDMILRATCGGSGSKLCVWADGWYREIARKASSGSSAVEEWPLRGLRKEMVDLVAGEPLRKLMIGVIQEGGQPRTLEVDKLEIRRVLD